MCSKFNENWWKYFLSTKNLKIFHQVLIIKERKFIKIFLLEHRKIHLKKYRKKVTFAARVHFKKKYSFIKVAQNRFLNDILGKNPGSI